ncbi:XdhC family protein [Rhizobium oryzicola]|uniref:XdhC family protein n=1 Tax=Rhizobium oryzicola TaxID=1232668 RepID=A0ABT8T6Q6_9HYPH|nr:XdhC family protein [Rhizobium oryzicola]MDO1585623.1 XdhC family protein [Rhizobium oryzicola]
MKLALLEKLNAARRARQAVVQIVSLDGGEGLVIVEGEATPDAFAEAVQSAFLSGKAGNVDVEGRPFFINAYLPPPRILAIGAVHITQALAKLAPVAGYDISIIDPRTAFATPERFEGIDLVADWPEDVLRERPLDAYTALVAVTHDPKIDDFPLADALRKGCFYVGALGSRKTHAKRVERLTALGLSSTEIDRIKAPIGLDIGAASPAEIAVAILAEVIAAYRCRSLASPVAQAGAAQ